MDETIRGALRALLTSKKFLSMLGGVFTAILTQGFGFLLQHYGDRLGLRPEMVAEIPGIADKLTGVVAVGLAAFVGAQGMADHGKEAAAVKVVGDAAAAIVESEKDV